MSTRVLVTGGLGFIGSHTCVELIESGFEVGVLDNLSNSSPVVVDRIRDISGGDLSLFIGDIRDKAKLNEVFSEFSPNAVIHFSGLKAVGDSV